MQDIKGPRDDFGFVGLQPPNEMPHDIFGQSVDLCLRFLPSAFTKVSQAQIVSCLDLGDADSLADCHKDH